MAVIPTLYELGDCLGPLSIFPYYLGKDMTLLKEVSPDEVIGALALPGEYLLLLAQLYNLTKVSSLLAQFSTPTTRAWVDQHLLPKPV